MKRGDVVTIAVSGDYGKPRPALVVQADVFEALPSVTVLRMTSDIQAENLVRILVQPTQQNGLRTASQVMVDKATTVPREKIGKVIGRIDAAIMREVSAALAAFLGLDGLVVLSWSQTNMLKSRQLISMDVEILGLWRIRAEAAAWQRRARGKLVVCRWSPRLASQAM